jgi:hypothetical protein
VHRGDRRLELVFAHRAAGDGLGEERRALGDALTVPLSAVLFREGDRPAVGCRAGRAAGIGEQHEGQQACRLGVVRDRPVQEAAQADRLLGKVDAVERGTGRGSIALVEQKVEDVAD